MSRKKRRKQEEKFKRFIIIVTLVNGLLTTLNLALQIILNMIHITK